jgi:hypothetical protein
VLLLPWLHDFHLIFHVIYIGPVCSYNLAPMERDCFSTPREILDLGAKGSTKLGAELPKAKKKENGSSIFSSIFQFHLIIFYDSL